METRTKKIQGRYKHVGRAGQRISSIIPTLELSGNWFSAAGFAPGQLVNIEAKNGILVITAAN